MRRRWPRGSHRVRCRRWSWPISWASAPSLGALLARLEADGCIERAAGEQDRRARRVALTDHGRDQAQEARDHQRAFARETLAVLDGAEKQQLAAIVLKINAALG